MNEAAVPINRHSVVTIAAHCYRAIATAVRNFEIGSSVIVALT